jgi:hypothetical protein
MSDPLDLDVQVAGPDEIDAFVALLEEAGGGLWRRGIRQWEPGSQHAQLPRLTRDLGRGCVRLARIEGKRAAGVISTGSADRSGRSGRQFVRLDCWSGNDRLRAYHADNGYVDCGEPEDHGSLVARFEKRMLANSRALESRGDRA